MAKKTINNAKPPDGNVMRNMPFQRDQVLISLLPDGFVTNPDELEVLKWALQTYLYQEKNQKISGKIFLNEITEQKKALAEHLLQKLA